MTTTTTLAGKTILITGGTRGVGAATTRALARLSPAKIYITGRPSSSSVADNLISSIRSEASSQSPDIADASTSKICKEIIFLPTDHSSLASVSATASHLLQTEKKLDVLICNAGIAATPLSQSVDGYEIQFATNFLGHALLIRKLLPLLNQSTSPGGVGGGRVISLGTYGYRFASSISFPLLSGPGLENDKDDLFGMQKWRRYAESKLAITLYTKELAKREKGIVAVTVTPGFVESDMLKGFNAVDYWVTKLGCWMIPGQRGLVTVEQGAENTVWAATVEGEEEEGGLMSGGYYDPVGKKIPEEEMSKAGRDGELARKLWEWTEGELEKWL